MYTANDIAATFEQIAPIETGLAGDQLGFVFGDPETQVKAVACIWNAHTQSIEASLQQGANMIICHEGLWLPEQTSGWYSGPDTHWLKRCR